MVGNSLAQCNKDGDYFYITANTPIRVTAHVRSPEELDWSYQIEIVDLSGKRKKLLIPFSDLIGSGTSALKTLADAGLVICPGMEKSLNYYIVMTKPACRMIKAPTAGWLNGFKTFSLPNQVIGETNGETVIFEPEENSRAKACFAISGTLDGWQANIAERCRGNHILVFGILLGLVGTFLKLLGIDGGGFHFHGISSKGKTTLLQVIVTPWGNGIDPAVNSELSFVRRWNLTGNALEAMSAAFSDTVLCLDELGTYNGNNLGGDTYNMAGGQGKAAMDSHRNLKTTRTWSNSIASSGEISFREKIEQSGRNAAKAGQMLRIVDIRIDDIMPSPPTGMTAGDFAQELKSSCAKHHGSAGPVLVERLIEHLQDDADETITMLRENLDIYTKELTVEGISPEQTRVLRRMAAMRVAGETAVQFGILPFTVEEVEAAVVHVRDLWLAENRTIADVDRALDRLHEFIVKNHTSFVSISDNQSKSSNIRAFFNPHKKLYLFTDDQLVAAIGGSGSAKDVALELRSRGLLEQNEPGRLKLKQKLASAGDRWIRFYAVRSAILEMESGGGPSDSEAENPPSLVEIEEEFDEAI